MKCLNTKCEKHARLGDGCIHASLDCDVFIPESENVRCTPSIINRIVWFVIDVIKYGPALPFVMIGVTCNQMCKWVVGGFLIGWTMNADAN